MTAGVSQKRAQAHERGTRTRSRHLRVIAIAIAVAALVLSGCGGKKNAKAAATNDAKNASTSTTARGSSAPTSTTTKNGTTGTTGSSGPTTSVLPASTPLVATWCQLRLGATAAEVQRAMGAPNGNNAALYRGVLLRGLKSLEWDGGNDVFVASFSGDRATILQAYDRKVGPVIGARDLPCNAYRRK